MHELVFLGMAEIFQTTEASHGGAGRTTFRTSAATSENQFWELFWKSFAWKTKEKSKVLELDKSIENPTKTQGNQSSDNIWRYKPMKNAKFWNEFWNFFARPWTLSCSHPFYLSTCCPQPTELISLQLEVTAVRWNFGANQIFYKWQLFLRFHASAGRKTIDIHQLFPAKRCKMIWGRRVWRPTL